MENSDTINSSEVFLSKTIKPENHGKAKLKKMRFKFKQNRIINEEFDFLRGEGHSPTRAPAPAPAKPRPFLHPPARPQPR